MDLIFGAPEKENDYETGKKEDPLRHLCPSGAESKKQKIR